MKFHQSVFQSVLALAAVALLAGTSAVSAQQQDKNRQLKKYESGTKEFWTHPPDDWFLGDETEAQKGLAPPSGRRPARRSRTRRMMKKIKLPAGFKIEVYASGRAGGAADGLGRQGHAVRRLVRPRQRLCDQGHRRQEGGQDRPQGLNMPTGLAFRDGALYVIASTS
jgi:hypothetical protein